MLEREKKRRTDKYIGRDGRRERYKVVNFFNVLVTNLLVSHIELQMHTNELKAMLL